jgi:23S rRNA (cytosine1962-C5)-methyltransferase
MQPLRLKPGTEKRILRGHRWVFSNEIADPLSDYTPGNWVAVFSAKGVHLGSGYINPKSLIAVRLICLPRQEPTRDFFHSLLQNANHRRNFFYPGSQCYRMVYGESDGVPGLVVDRYGGVLVYQITTLGMAAMEELIREVLIEICRPVALVFRNDAGVRALEGLPLEKGLAFGSVPPDHSVSIDGAQMQIDVFGGQKTGFYLDQRDNRKALLPWIKGKRVLDLFCYNGAWSVAAAKAGATEVIAVDQSLAAIELARKNAQLNGAQHICNFLEQDVFQFLKNAPKGEFDIIIVDPPAFAKNKKSLPEAKRKYIDLNRRALLALKRGGLLVTCSCSYHLSADLFQDVLLQAAQASGRQLRLVEARGQSKDHPVLLAMPETSYLKCYFLEDV